MAVKSIGAYQTKIYQLIFGLLLVALGLMAVRRMMSGTVQSGQMIAAVVIGFAMVMILDRRYWLLLPILGGFGMKVPGLPFNGAELGQISVVAIHAARLGLHRDTPAKLGADTWPIFPVFFWIAGIFCMNPSGLAMLGNSTIGSRFYMQIALGFFVFFALSAQRLNESDCKLLFRTLILATLFRLCREILLPQADPDALTIGSGEPERNARYAFVGFSTLYLYLFAKYSLPEIAGSFIRIGLVAVFSALTIYSGKRRMAGQLFLIPWFSVFLRKCGQIEVCILSFFAIIVLSFLIAGDGTYYETPKSAQRALAIVAPRKYLKDTDSGGIHDAFRRGMRKQARNVISLHPFVGRKGFSMSFEETLWGMHTGEDAIYASHAASGNWHSAVYSFAADFGLPCLILFALFFLKSTFFEYHQCRTIRAGTYAHVMMMVYALNNLCTLVFSYTSGHSAETFAWLCNNYGWAIAIAGAATRQDVVVNHNSVHGEEERCVA